MEHASLVRPSPSKDFHLPKDACLDCATSWAGGSTGSSRPPPAILRFLNSISDKVFLSIFESQPACQAGHYVSSCAAGTESYSSDIQGNEPELFVAALACVHRTEHEECVASTLLCPPSLCQQAAESLTYQAVDNVTRVHITVVVPASK